ncbi:sensor histidine kinase [Streptacidiphilus fuscans]|uniref:histidine kinase n=1 Tax=Streptacidiphilus fuscans TaxID=2789292 RepID=A0A931B5X0_9ACTN|nr:histidine kinase [Streptacidiphilus fuscans]MBF9071684.1 two-component sensor histidine kinase [Streptacidiphilus fuscans]
MRRRLQLWAVRFGRRIKAWVMRLPKPVRDGAITLVLMAAAFLDAGLNYPGKKDWTFWASMVSCVVLAGRRRWPRLVLFGTLTGLFAGTALVASLVALYTVARSRRVDWQAWVAAAVVGIGIFLPWPISKVLTESASDHIQQLIYAVMFSIGPTALGLLLQTREALSARIVELATLRDHERELHAQTVIARERARIAREMHDVVSHQAGLIAVQAGALQVTATDPGVREVAGTMRGLAVATLEELRSMILVLRAAGAGPTELVPQPRLTDLPRLVAESEAGAALEVVGYANGDMPVLPEPIERAAYRTVQEALTNARKHAPGAETQVRVELRDDSLRVAVTNSSPPELAPDPAEPAVTSWEPLPGGGHGIVGLRERAALLGGTLAAGPTADGGFKVRLSLPLTGAAR